MPFLLRPLIEALVDQLASPGDRVAAHAPRIVIDVDPGHVVDADAGTVRRALQALLEAAFNAAARPAPPREGPALHEVVVTSVVTPAGVEIEIADSGADTPHALDLTLATTRSALGRLDGTLRVDACPEGGRAVTVVLPHRSAQRMAA